jgi:hypothetical protein
VQRTTKRWKKIVKPSSRAMEATSSQDCNMLRYFLSKGACHASQRLVTSNSRSKNVSNVLVQQSCNEQGDLFSMENDAVGRLLARVKDLGATICTLYVMTIEDIVEAQKMIDPSELKPCPGCGELVLLQNDCRTLAWDTKT